MKYKTRNLFVVVVAAVGLSACGATTGVVAPVTNSLAPKPAAQKPRGDADTTDANAASMVMSFVAEQVTEKPKTRTSGRGQLDALIKKYAQKHQLPVSFVHHVVNRESTYNPNARNGIHVGLMQLNPATARSMGFEGASSKLYDPETNLKYGVKYLAGAYLVADGNTARADRLYQTGYYYQAKRKGLLEETGLR